MVKYEHWQDNGRTVKNHTLERETVGNRVDTRAEAAEMIVKIKFPPFFLLGELKNRRQQKTQDRNLQLKKTYGPRVLCFFLLYNSYVPFLSLSCVKTSERSFTLGKKHIVCRETQ